MSRLQQRFHSSPGKREGIEPLNLSECCNTKDYTNSSASASARSLPRAKSAVFTENGVVDEKQRDKDGQRQTSASTDEKLDGNPPSACTVLSAVVLQKSADVWPIRSSPSVGGTLAAPFDSAHSSKDLHPLTDRRRRSSIILNKRMPMRKTESGELGDRTASKLTLDEELYDILHAFLEADRGEKDEEEETAGKPLTRQHLLNKIREKKEVINKLRCQAWNMNRKRRTLRLAQKYLEQNESKVSKTHLYKEELVKRWRWFLRWLSNIGIYFVPWESRIKRIESQFGSVVSSYFTFLRWVIFINFIITAIIIAFVVVPECAADATADAGRQNRTASRKRIPPEEQSHVDEWAVVWHFDGYLRVSPLFYGFYSNDPYISEAFKYPLPLAYFLAAISVFCFSLFIILRRISLNARLSKLSGSKAEQYVFNWKLFTGWDYSIGNGETATNTAMAAVIKLREAINECQIHAQRRCKPSLWAIRLATNTVIIAMILLSIYCIHTAVQSSETVEKSSGSIFTKNQVPLLLSTITHIFPMIFDLIGRIEKHHAKLSLRLHLIRISSLYVINYATLIYSLFEKLDNIRDISRTMDDVPTAMPTTGPTPAAVSLMMFVDGGGDDGTGRARQWQKWRRERKQSQRKGTPSKQQQPKPFLSRNFSTPRQLQRFFATAKTPTATNSTEVMWQEQQRHRKNAAGGGEDEQRDENGQVTVGGSSFTVHVQFGPVGVNNPTALVRNTTTPSVPLDSSQTPPSTVTKPRRPPYETRRIGPTPLPTFVPPSRPPTSRQPTFTGLNYGPDWAEIERERERARARKLPPNITVERVADGLPMSWPTQTTTVSNGSTRTFRPPLTHRPKAAQPMPTTPRPYFSQTTEWPTTWSSTSTETSADRFAKISSTNVPKGTTSKSAKEFDENGEEEETLYDDSICWETMIGQEIVKLVTMDLYITIISIFLIDFVRGLWIRYCSTWWCWDIETTFPEYGEFKVAENVLHICNNQGMVWLGLFFAPLLPAINNVKLIIIMYIRGWACVTCNVPAREIFRASRSSNFFLAILLSALLLCTVPVGYVLTSKQPSVLCGPFAERHRFYDVLTELIIGNVPKRALRWLRYGASPGVIIPTILLLILFIVFLISLVRGLRKANTDLQKQLIHERTEEKRKIFELAGGANRNKTKASTKAEEQRKKMGGGAGRKLEQGQHLPEVERKRREPWRLFANLAKNRKGADLSSLCPSDEPPSSTLPSPSVEEQRAPFSITSADAFPPQKAQFAAAKPPLGMPSAAIPTDWSPRSAKLAYHPPSIGSLDEAESGGRQLDISAPREEYESKLSTPDELRTLVAPFHHPAPLASSSVIPSSVSPVHFPRSDAAGCAMATFFGTEVPTAKENKKRKSNEEKSLYEELHSPKFIDDSARTEDEGDNEQKEPKRTAGDGVAVGTALSATSKSRARLTTKSRPSSAWCPPAKHSLAFRLEGPLAPLGRPIIHSPRLISTHFPPSHAVPRPSASMTRSADASVISGVPSVEAPHRISLYSREPRRIGLPTASTATTPTTRKSTSPTASCTTSASGNSRRPALLKRQPSLPSSAHTKIHETPPKTMDKFVPWPAPNEIRRQLRPTPLGRERVAAVVPAAHGAKVRGRSPPKMIKSVHSAELSPPPAEPCRFRITVSPTRRLDQGPPAAGPSAAAYSPPRRLLINQQVITGSTSTVGAASNASGAMDAELMSTASTPRRPPALNRNYRHGSTTAPRAVFGDDDSPQVEQKQSPYH